MHGGLNVFENEESITVCFVEPGRNISSGNAIASKYTGAVVIEDVNPEKIWYFNRIKTENAYRGRGIANQVLRCLLEAISRRGIILLCHINPYGPLDMEHLRRWYISHGFKTKRLRTDTELQLSGAPSWNTWLVYDGRIENPYRKSKIEKIL